ncbi:hypothetical protein K1719_038391 [Acacia pycnantha]|nr:hypothetical protein K1719_038391 [Acacia pycnantha]
MDWNLKGGSWDLSELDGGGLPNIETRVDNYNMGSTRFGLMKGSGGEFCFDLKLGQVASSGTEPSSGFKWKAAKTAATSGASGSSKRARAINNGIQSASCLVDGCSSDLSNCREYHRRHKVCELHSKTSVVTIGGHKQRFCQQCSRFHSLEEFDEGKRSCRKRLDGHNRRRRKPQPVPLTRSATLFSNYHQGRQLLPFSSDSNLYPSSSMEMTTYLEKPCIEALKTGTATARSGSFSSSPPPPCALSLLSSPPPAPMYLSSQPLATAALRDHHGLQEAVDTTLLVSNGSHQPSMYNLLGSAASHTNNSQSLPFHWE